MHIVNKVAGQVRNLCHDLLCNSGMPMRRDEDTQTGRG